MIIQCDFDGTIIRNNLSVLLREKYTRGDWQKIDSDYLHGYLTVEQSNKLQFAFIKESKERLQEFVRQHIELRPGFLEFVRYCQESAIPFVIVSSGLDFYIESVLVEIGMPDFGELEADRCLDQLMKWIVAGQIQVVDQAPKIIEKAMAYVRLATRNKACALRAWDAVHLTQANYWSRLMDAPVNIVTNDGVFLDFLRAFPEFTEFIRVYNPLKKRFYP